MIRGTDSQAEFRKSFGRLQSPFSNIILEPEELSWVAEYAGQNLAEYLLQNWDG